MGTLSADGHNWIVQAEPNDYTEKEFGSFYRSYPSQGGDALAYQRDGFLWNAAEKAGLSVADFGEYDSTLTLASPAPTWTQWYTDAQDLEKGASTASLPTPLSAAQSTSDIPSLNAVCDHDYPGFDLDIPDQYRVDIWEQAFRTSEQTGQFANLTLMALPDDPPPASTRAILSRSPRWPTTTSPWDASCRTSRIAASGRARPSS